MKLRSVISGVLSLGLVTIGVVGCSRYVKEQRSEWRVQAEKACIRSGAVKESQHVKIARALEGPGSCGADHPVKVSAFTVAPPEITASSPGFFSSRPQPMLTKLNQEGTLTCPMYSAVERWLEQVVQPAALARFGQPVAELRLMGTYSCRRMNNGTGTARMSEHSFANAIDIGGFRLQDGTIITVLRGWKGDLEQQNFLREVHMGACKNFATVLGPGADAFHYDHFHFDLARHGRRGDRSICRPYPQPVSPAPQTVPFDPGRSAVMSDGGRAIPRQPNQETYAYAQAPRSGAILPPGNVGGAPLPGYRPAQLPAAPRNPVAERELAETGQPPVPSRNQRQRPVGDPVMLYGRGQGPFLPLREDEIDPQDIDPVTGSVGE
jgi:hypothetical protein